MYYYVKFFTKFSTYLPTSCTLQNFTREMVNISDKQDACTGVHSAYQREENGHNLDICALRRLRLRQGQMQGFLGLKVGGGGGLICKYGI